MSEDIEIGMINAKYLEERLEMYQRGKIELHTLSDNLKGQSKVLIISTKIIRFPTNTGAVLFLAHPNRKVLSIDVQPFWVDIKSNVLTSRKET